MTETRAKEAHVWERDPLDWYVEGERVTEQLLSVERFDGPVHDPCCGGGNIVRTLLRHGCEATGSDVVDRAGSPPWFFGVHDFLTEPNGRFYNYVMNPPYFGGKGTEAFIRAALPLVLGKLCVFVDRRFLTGRRRAQTLYRDHPPTRVWEISPRPSCPPGAWLAAGNKAGGGTADYCWLVWDKTAPPNAGTALGWLSEIPKPDFEVI